MRPFGTGVTRLSAALSLVALVAVALSDFLLSGFWDRNAMVTSVVADVLVLVVGVAVVNEFVAARSRREWRLLSDYAVVELGESARRIWGTLAQHVGVGKRESLTLDELRARVRSREGAEATRQLALGVANDRDQRVSLHQVVSELAEEARARLGRWAPVLVETPYTRAVTNFVQLQARLTRLETVLREDSLNWRPSYEGSGDIDWIATRVADVIDLGSDLEVRLLSAVEHPERWGEPIPESVSPLT